MDLAGYKRAKRRLGLKERQVCRSLAYGTLPLQTVAHLLLNLAQMVDLFLHFDLLAAVIFLRDSIRLNNDGWVLLHARGLCLLLHRFTTQI